MNDFLGRGWAFPVTTTSQGRIALSEGPDDIDGALRCILSTAPGERLMRPDFGCAIWNRVFSPLDANTLGLLEQDVREAVATWEPRVDMETVTVTPDAIPGRVRIDLRYRIRATNDRRNLVHPFYVIPSGQPPEELAP